MIIFKKEILLEKVWLSACPCLFIYSFNLIVIAGQRHIDDILKRFRTPLLSMFASVESYHLWLVQHIKGKQAQNTWYEY